MEENMKRFFSMAALLALGCSLVFAGGGGQQSGSSGQSSTIVDQTAVGDIFSAGTDIHDTTADIDVSNLTLKSAPGLSGNAKDRLPKVPKLVNEMPKDLLNYQVGKYGGTMRFVTMGNDWDADVFIMCTEALLNSPGLLGKEVTGNVLQGYTVTDDQKEFTFYMREGLRWSDGVPVTMEDVRFAVEDVLFNEVLTPSVSSRYRSGGMGDGTPMKFSIVDDWTFKIAFDQPYGGFLIALSIQGWVGYTDLVKPAHYLKPYHTKYATAADKAKWPALFREYGYAENDPYAWGNLFNKIDITNWDLCQKVGIGFPKLYPWILTSANDTVYTYTRNPYYFKIDSAGNQLPYVDKIESYRVENMEMVQLKMISGEVDLARESASLVNVSLYKQNEKNGYTTYMTPMHVTPSDVLLNLTWAEGDEEYISIVRNKKFRHALNKAIDREEIIDTVYYGFAEPAKDFSDSTLDPVESERLLQEIGMRKGSDGFYRTPSGKPFEIIFEMVANAPDLIPVSELVAEMWKGIGIKTTVRVMESSLRDSRQAANQMQARVIWTSSPQWTYNDYGMGSWGRAWEMYFNNTTNVTITNADGTETVQSVRGEVPPPEVMEFQRMVASMFTGSLADANATYEKVKQNFRENLWGFIHLENVKQPVLINSKLRNVAIAGFGIGINYGGEILWYDN
jgi:peptide/nickel transport system substrate-binding protein